MTNPVLLHRRRAPSTARPLVRAACSGVLLGLMSSACVISIHDGSWGSDQEACFDAYGDCMDDAESPAQFEACDATLDNCLDGYADEAGDGDGDASSSSSTSQGEGDGSSSTSQGEGDSSSTSSDSGDAPPHADTGDAPPHADTGDTEQACFEIYATCIGEAQTLQDVDACEVLFDQCVNPGQCESPGCGCPEAELGACLDCFAGCLENAGSEAEADACATDFDACAAQFDFSQCQPGYDEALLDACLDQHGLCVACADTPEQLLACKSTFDSCLAP